MHHSRRNPPSRHSSIRRGGSETSNTHTPPSHIPAKLRRRARHCATNWRAGWGVSAHRADAPNCRGDHFSLEEREIDFYGVVISSVHGCSKGWEEGRFDFTTQGIPVPPCGSDVRGEMKPGRNQVCKTAGFPFYFPRERLHRTWRGLRHFTEEDWRPHARAI